MCASMTYLAGIFGEVDGLFYCCVAAPNYGKLLVPERVACTYSSVQLAISSTLWGTGSGHDMQHQSGQLLEDYGAVQREKVIHESQ